MKYISLSAALMVLIVAAMLTASVTKQSQTHATVTVGPASQDQPNNSAKASAKTSRRKIPCKTPENASLCYWTRGRLSVWEGGPPSYRIWKIGTHRLLGVFKGTSRYPAFTDDDAFNPEISPEP